MKTIRAFFAIVPPASALKQLGVLLHQLDHAIPNKLIKLVKTQALHVTLQFIQSIQPEHVPVLIERVRALLLETPSFDLELGAMEWFPSIHHPKLISLSAGPQDVLTDLSQKIGHVLNELNYPPELRPFRGHLSLARIIKNIPDEINIYKIQQPIVEPIHIARIYLMESKTFKEGAEYTSLAEFKLASSSAR